MKKIHLLWLTLVALFAFGAVVANAAFAEEALWLVKGVEVKEALPSETTGELLLIVLKEPIIGETWILCSGTFDGVVGPGSADLVNALLNLAKEEIGSELVGLALICEGELGCEKTADVEVWADNLPWNTVLELMTVEGKTVFLDLFFKETGKEPGYHIAKCLVIGTSNTDLCTGETSSILELVGANLIGKFVPEDQELELLEANCETAGEKQGLAEGEGTITLTSGEELDVSSP